MPGRFVCIWFCHLTTDWQVLRRPDLKNIPFVFAAPDHGRLLITSSSPPALLQGLYPGMAVADAKAVIPGLEVIDEVHGRAEKLLKGLAEWCIRYTPVISMHLPDSLILDASGCTHLFGGEQAYVDEIIRRLAQMGYTVKAGMANTIGAAWAVSHFSTNTTIVKTSDLSRALVPLPAAALRLEQTALQRLQKLGLRTIGSFITMPRSALRRRFGQHLLLRLDQALGNEDENLEPVKLPEPYHERLPSMEAIRTATGIEIAIQQLLQKACDRLRKENKGLRKALLRCYRVDGKRIEVGIGTNRPSSSVTHLFKLFELKIPTIEPALGIELFTLDLPKVEEMPLVQEMMWGKDSGLNDPEIAELLDRLAGKVGPETIRRYLPVEHHWPERSIRVVSSLKDKSAIEWRTDKQRPIQLLPKPATIEVTAPIPDYPPMMFRYQGKLHTIRKADGPERIEREWWMDHGEHRDYYQVEDEEGKRYWLFRSGHYTGDQGQQWFIHGFFA